MKNTWKPHVDINENFIVSRFDGPPPSEKEKVAYVACGHIYSSTGFSAESYLKMNVAQWLEEHGNPKHRIVKETRTNSVPMGSGHKGRVRVFDDWMAPNLYVITEK